MKASRILLIIRPGIGGAAKHVAMLVRLHCAHRADLDVITSPLESAHFCDQLEQYGARVYRVPMTRPITPWKDLVAFAKILRILLRGQYRVVHTHASKAGFLGRCAALLCGVPRILYTPHGFYFNYRLARWQQRFFLLLEKALACWTSKIICITPQEGQQVHQVRLAPPRRIAVITNAVEIPHNMPASLYRERLYRELQISGPPPESHDHAPIVGMVGRLDPPKDPLTFVQAAAQVHAMYPRAVFVLVGDGRLLPAARQCAAQLNLQHCCHFLGYRQDALELMAAFDIAVLASYWEGLPYVLLESMALGKPVIGPDICGCRDVVQPGHNGFLYPPGNASVLAGRIQQLLARPKLAHQMGKTAQMKMQDEFAPQQWIQRIQQLYDQ